MEIVGLTVKANKEEAEERLTLAAFVGFQMGAGKQKNFMEYLRSLGIDSTDTKPKQKPRRKKPAGKDESLGRLKMMGIVPEKVKW